MSEAWLTVINSEGVTAPLEAVPEVPGQLEEISTANYLVVDRSRGVELGTLAVVTVGGLVWVAVVLGCPVKPQVGPATNCETTEQT